VKPRLTAWLAALLIFNGVFNVPVVRVSTARVAVCAVYCERKKVRAEQIADAVPSVSRPEQPDFAAGSPRGRAAAANFDSRLFQRPPPVLSL
jgi:hypothetical protein